MNSMTHLKQHIHTFSTPLIFYTQKGNDVFITYSTNPALYITRNIHSLVDAKIEMLMDVTGFHDLAIRELLKIFKKEYSDKGFNVTSNFKDLNVKPVVLTTKDKILVAVQTTRYKRYIVKKFDKTEMLAAIEFSKQPTLDLLKCLDHSSQPLQSLS